MPPAADSDARQRAIAHVKGLPVAHRVMIGGAAVVVLLAGYLFFRWVSSPSYVLARADIAPGELTEITDALNTAGIGFELNDAGTRLSVRRQDLAAARSAFADAGVTGPDDGPGGESDRYRIEASGFATPRELREESLRLAHQADIEAALRRYLAIEDADVTLVIPAAALFADEEEPATASVVLELRDEIGEQQVLAVAGTVANSVEGLTVDDVLVTESSGRVLHQAGVTGQVGPGGNLDLTRQVEVAMEADVRRILESAGGGPGSTAIVTAVLDFDETTTESVTYDPENVVALREDVSAESYNGINADAAGIPGVDGGVTVGDDGTFEYVNNVTVQENGVNRTTTFTTKAVGTVSQINVAATIDDGSLTGIDPADPDQVATLIAAGVGLQPDRGDQIAVESVAVPAADPDAAEATTTADDGGGLDILALATQAIGALALLGVIGTLVLMARRRSDDADGEVVTLELEGGETRAELAGAPAGLTPREEVIELVQQQPDEIAALLRGWLAEK